jgi:hypothetical protein
MGIEGDPRPRKRWAQKGAKIRVPYYGEHLRRNVTGMVGPRLGQFYALEFTHSDSEVFQVFLNHANQDVKLERPRNILDLRYSLLVEERIFGKRYKFQIPSQTALK